MTVLLIIDMQNDFMPGGALAVPKADLAIPVINKLMPKFSLVVATQDWHPKDHMSFAGNHPGKKPGDVVDLNGVRQILWPAHCVQNSKGAELVANLKKEKIAHIVQKGTDKWIDSYSAFFDNARKRSTGLYDYLKKQNVREIFLCGVATDYCVLFSVLDALELGFSVTVIADACYGIDLHKGDVEAAFARMAEKGATIIPSLVLR